ncbi:MAG: protein kinase, partial [Parachlamydiales bacterium]
MEEKNLGNYRILKHLAKGGMGEVFLAFDPVCSRTVALKKIREDFKKNPLMRRRFLKEAQIASRLTHPAVIPIYSIHDDENEIYYTMPYVEGKSLKELLIEASQDPAKHSIPHFIRIFLSVCEAVAFAHLKKILHRDLKPANILVGKYGEVLVLDWGIATFTDQKPATEELKKKAENDPGLSEPEQK